MWAGGWDLADCQFGNPETLIQVSALSLTCFLTTGNHNTFLSLRVGYKRSIAKLSSAPVVSEYLGDGKV